MNWINTLHLYQPPTQTKEIVDQVSRESYERIVALLDRYPQLRLTVNISGSLLELLERFGHKDVIDGLRRHAERGAVEFLGSAMYHPILPLLSAKEIRRQVKLHTDLSKRCFGDAYAPKGFYFPEMAYSAEAAKVVKELGFEWTVLDEVHTTEDIDPRVRYTIKGVGLGVIFRDSSYSRTFPPESISKAVENTADGLAGRTIVTCHDGELYGHWHKDDQGYYQRAFTNPDIHMHTVSEYLGKLEREGEIGVRDASWESQPEELEENVSLGLWNHPRNDIHQMLESFKRDVLKLVEEHQDDPAYGDARHRADRGVASCAWWWASERRLGPFSPLTWNPTEIEKGAKELFGAVEVLKNLPSDARTDIEKRFAELRTAIWDKHRRKYDPDYPA